MNILFIAIDFFNYDKIIAEEMRKQGHNVFLYYDQPKRLIVGLEYVLPKKIVDFENRNYQKKVLKKIMKKKIDVVFVLVGRYLSSATLAQLRLQHPDARFVLYLWDDVARVSNYKCVKNYYDSIFSFDDVDCKNEDLIFLPLFYTKDCKLNDVNKEIDIFSNLSLHSDRYEIICKMIEKYPCFNIVVKLYVLPRIFYSWVVRGKLKSKTLNFRIEASSKTLSRTKMINFIQKSRCILDIQAPSQNGLTMRSIEALGCGVKLITTNKNIKKYDFYNGDNILVIDRNNIDIPEDFISKVYTKIPENLYCKYSLYNWLKVILGEQEIQYLR